MKGGNKSKMASVTKGVNPIDVCTKRFSSSPSRENRGIQNNRDPWGGKTDSSEKKGPTPPYLGSDKRFHSDITNWHYRQLEDSVPLDHH